MSPATLPRPEDRRRGDLERLFGCAGPLASWRSEGFAEDLAAEAAISRAAADPQPSVARWRPMWPPAWRGLTPQPGR